MPHKINVALQILPLGTPDTIRIIDAAIEKIQISGLKYVVCPFETVIEGEYEEVMKLIGEVQETCFQAGAGELIANLKIHRFADRSALIAEKMEKW